MHIQTEEIIVPDQKWKLYTLSNDNGMEISFLDYGGIITKILVPDKNGNFENTVLSYKNYEDYLENPNYFGALIGRVAGRIKGSEFVLDGETYSLESNDGKNHLHGGSKGFHQVLWNTQSFENDGVIGVELSHLSPDGDSGYPGTVGVKVTYSLNNKNEFQISYEAMSNKKTALTLTNHVYFNLSGNLKTDVLDHEVTIDSDNFVEIDEALIPTGNKPSVDNTVFDFRNGRQIKDGSESENNQNLIAGNGYDHYFILNKKESKDIIVRDYSSGREIVVKTDQPGFVMYTSNSLGNGFKLSECESRKHLGLCLETQGSPASLHNNDFPSIILDKNEAYLSMTSFSFNLI